MVMKKKELIQNTQKTASKFIWQMLCWYISILGYIKREQQIYYQMDDFYLAVHAALQTNYPIYTLAIHGVFLITINCISDKKKIKILTISIDQFRLYIGIDARKGPLFYSTKKYDNP